MCLNKYFDTVMLTGCRDVKERKGKSFVGSFVLG